MRARSVSMAAGGADTRPKYLPPGLRRATGETDPRSRPEEIKVRSLRYASLPVSLALVAATLVAAPASGTPPGSNQLPIGSHDGSPVELATPADCYANGWAVDPDRPNRPVNVRLFVDDVEQWSDVADDLRVDIREAGIGNGYAGWSVSLMGFTTLDVSHLIRVEAQDLETAEWQPLDGTPRTITCTNQAPVGSHAANDGVTSPLGCFAAGWADDPDATGQGVPLRILADGDEIWQGDGGQWRADLFDLGAPDGVMKFLVDLESLLAADVEYEVRVQAQDQTGDWVDLDDTPRTLTCARVAIPGDLHSLSLKDGQVTRLTDTPEAGEFDAHWAPGGKKMVNDLEAYDEGGRLQHRLVVTDVATGSWTPVPSGTDGNNAAWSPNGKWLAFDRSVGFEQYPPFPMCFACDLSVRVASLDGTTRLVVRDALDPEWAPTSTRFVFNRPTSDGVWTVDLDGNETPLGVLGLTPSWSPNGRWIAYSRTGNLWKIAVTSDGAPGGSAVQLTNGGFALDDWGPTWSADGATIYFVSNRGGESAIWAMPAAGGEPVRVTDPPAGSGDVAPSVSPNGRSLVFTRIIWP
jgi:hypothetical protein